MTMEAGKPYVPSYFTSNLYAPLDHGCINGIEQAFDRATRAKGILKGGDIPAIAGDHGKHLAILYLNLQRHQAIPGTIAANLRG